jgi:hypothetical protein
VSLRADGTGRIVARVALDADAVQRLTANASLADAVPLADVRAAGWKVSPWKPTKGGGEAITLSREFVGEAGLRNRIADLVGTRGVLRDPRITRTRGWFGASDKISVVLDMRSISASVRADPQLAASLHTAGLDVNTLDAQLSSELKQSLLVTVAVHAPGGQTNEAAVAAGNIATLSASTSQTYTRRMLLLAAGGVLLLLAILIMGAALLTRSRPRRRSSASDRR